MVTMCDLFEKEKRVADRRPDADLLVKLFRSYAMQDPEVKSALLLSRSKLGLRNGPKYLLELFSTQDASVACYGLAPRSGLDIEPLFHDIPLTTIKGVQQHTALISLERLVTFDDLTGDGTTEISKLHMRGYLDDGTNNSNIEQFISNFTVESHWKINL